MPAGLPLDAPAPIVAPPVDATTVAPTPALPVTDPQAVARQAIGDAQAAQTDEAKAAQAEAKATQAKADADAKAADAAAAEMRKRQEENDRQQAASEQARTRLVAIAEKADSDVAGYKFSDYKDTISGSQKMWLIAGAALAGLGGSSDPMAQINKNIAQHFEKQKAELSSKENFAAAKRAGVGDFDRHRNDQRMELEFKERNYREALAKEIEAQGLRSGKPAAAAKAQQMAAKVRMDGDAKLSTMIDQYTKGEEARAHADLYARKGRAAAGGGAGGRTGEDDLADAAGKGASYSDLVKMAVSLKAKGKLGPKDDPRKVAKDILEGSEKDTQTIVYDPDTGQPLARAPSGRNVAKITDDFASTRSYVKAVNDLAAHIEQHGRLLNPLTDEAKMRASLAADVQSKGRQVQGIQASDAGAKLEHAVIGGAGVGLDTMASPEVLRRLAKEASEKAETKLRMGLSPISSRSPSESGNTPEVGGGAPKIPAGAVTGTMNGKRGYVLDGKFTAL